MTDANAGPTHRPLTMEEASAKRWADLAKTILDVSFGTLWWGKETLWQELLSGYNMRSDRVGHPALSMHQGAITDLYSQIPMLLGFSKNGSLKVKGLTEKEPARITRFGSRLAPVPIHEATPWNGPCRIRRNEHKPRLDKAEMEQLEKFAKHRRLSI